MKVCVSFEAEVLPWTDAVCNKKNSKKVVTVEEFDKLPEECRCKACARIRESRKRWFGK